MKNKNQIIFIVALFFAILFFNNISAVGENCVIVSSTSCPTYSGTTNVYKAVMDVSGPDDNAITPTNAHAKSPSKVLCCNFGGGTNTCDATDSNKFLRISSPTNAHAEQPQ